MVKKNKYTQPATFSVDLRPTGLLETSGDSTGFEDKPGEDDVIYEQRRRNIWESNDWLKAGRDKKQA